jgi:hypothetical protein
MLFLLLGVAEGCGASQQLPGPDHPGGILPGLPRPLHCCQELRPGSGQISGNTVSVFIKSRSFCNMSRVGNIKKNKLNNDSFFKG